MIADENGSEKGVSKLEWSKPMLQKLDMDGTAGGNMMMMDAPMTMMTGS